MKISTTENQALHNSSIAKSPANKAKFNLKNWLKKEIKEREKKLLNTSKISQEYCQKCKYGQICYNNLERKEWRRLHKDHKLNFIEKIKRGW